MTLACGWCETAPPNSERHAHARKGCEPKCELLLLRFFPADSAPSQKRSMKRTQPLVITAAAPQLSDRLTMHVVMMTGNRWSAGQVIYSTIWFIVIWKSALDKIFQLMVLFMPIACHVVGKLLRQISSYKTMLPNCGRTVSILIRGCSLGLRIKRSSQSRIEQSTGG